MSSGRQLGHAISGVAAVLAVVACGDGDASVAVPGLDGAPPAGEVPPVPAPPSTLPASSAAAEPGAAEPGDAEPDAAEPDAAGDSSGRDSDAPAAATTTAPAGEAAEDVFLRRGDEGDEVSSLQRRLIAVGYLAPGGETGVFDDATADALIDFQAQYGLIVDGIFGPESDRALNAAAASVDDAAG